MSLKLLSPRLLGFIRRKPLLNPPEADKIGFDWVCFKQLKVGCSLLLVIVITKVTTIFGFSGIGFVLHNLLFLIERFSATENTDDTEK